MMYPLYRLAVLAPRSLIGIALWLFLNRTRIGMMIRAGVDDRGMLSVSGTNVHVVFATVFAIGAGLAGFAGVIGGTALSIAPGEDVRYLLASLVVVIVGGMGSITGRRGRGAADRPRRADRPRLFPDLWRRAHLRDHGGGAGAAAAGHHGAARMTALAEPASRPRSGRPRAGPRARCRRMCSTAIAAAGFSALRVAVLHLPDRRLFAAARHHRAVRRWCSAAMAAWSAWPR